MEHAIEILSNALHSHDHLQSQSPPRSNPLIETLLHQWSSGVLQIVQYIICTLLAHKVCIQDQTHEHLDTLLSIDQWLGAMMRDDFQNVSLTIPDQACQSHLIRFYSTFLISVLLKEDLPFKLNLKKDQSSDLGT